MNRTRSERVCEHGGDREIEAAMNFRESLERNEPRPGHPRCQPGVLQAAAQYGTYRSIADHLQMGLRHATQHAREQRQHRTVDLVSGQSIDHADQGIRSESSAWSPESLER